MQDTEFDTPLIQAKLLRPILPVDLVPRPQLTEWLDARCQQPVTLFCPSQVWQVHTRL